MTRRVDVRFYGELNHFLPPGRAGTHVRVDVADGTTVKDLAESMGVPHTEIDVVLANGRSVGFEHQVVDGDRVGFFPDFDALDVTPLLHLRPPPPSPPRFVADVHLGKLARLLRLVGFDTVWRSDADDAELVAESVRDSRIVLSRDRGLLKRRAVVAGAYVRATDRRDQIVEVLRRFDLFGSIDPFGRCLACNGRLQSAAKTDVEDELPPRTRLEHDEFRRCSDCGRIYWRGSHYDHLQAIVDDIRRAGSVTDADTGGVLADAGGATLLAALESARRGWSVVPLHGVSAGRCACGHGDCPAPGKHPHVAWDTLRHTRAGDDQLRRWWRRWPDANVGLVTGAVSGIVVVDVDPRNGGDGTLDVLEAANGPLPVTVEAVTGGGGRHLYFRHPGGEVRSGTLAAGIDVKADGGLVVAPPSMHVSGDRYRWRTGRSPEELEPAQLPPWLLAQTVSLSGSADRRAAAPPPRTEGERGEFAAWWASAGIELRAGDHTYLCPFHADHRPSLHIDADGCRFHCFGCGEGGGIARLRRLLGGSHAPARPGSPPPPPAAVAPAATVVATITVEGSEDVDVVGTSHHQQALLEVTGGRRRYGGAHVATVATLVPDPGNPHDADAVAVTIAGRVVGYLSHADALRCRRRIDDAIASWGRATCAASIVGGWERAHGDVGSFGVRLRL